MDGQEPQSGIGPDKKSLRILILSDNRPGHFNQAKGVLRALRFHREIIEDWVPVRLRAAAARPVLSFLLNRSPKPQGMRALHWCYQIGPLPDSRPDLILSAGGNTVFSNCWLSRELGCRNLFVGLPRRLKPHCFWRCLTFAPHDPSPPFIHWQVTPVPIQPEEIAAEGRRYRESEGLVGQSLWTILVGGDGGGAVYTPEDWQALVSGLRSFARSMQIRWLIVTSRRTGPIGESILKQFAEEPEVARLSLFSVDQGQRYRDFLGAGERIVTTEDSHMMLTEAISTGRSVLCVRPRHSQPDWTGQLFLENYTREGYVVRASIEQMSNPTFCWTPSAKEFRSPLRELGSLIDSWFSAEGV